MTEPESSPHAPEPASSEPASPDQLPPAPSDGRREPVSSVSIPPLLGEKKKRRSSYAVHNAKVSRRRDKIVAEIERNRRGEAAIPTWVLATILLVLIAGLAALVIFG